MASLFSKMILGEIPCHKVWDQNNIMAILDINPINEGHLLVIPHEEVDDLFNLSKERYQEIWNTVRLISDALKKAFNCPRVGVAVEGFLIPHAHIHLVPVYNGNELNPKRAKPASTEDLEKSLALLKKELPE